MPPLSRPGRAATLTATARQREIFARILAKGIQNGELADDADVDALSWYYFGVLQAIVNLPNAGADLGILNRMIELSMAAWPENDRPS